jgi:hypothetical protein
MREHVPWTIWAFIAAMIATLVVAALPGDFSMGNPTFAVALTLLWSVLLIRRSRAAWAILVVLYGLSALSLAAFAVWPWSAGLAVVFALIGASLATLLARPTRRWVGRARLE